MNISSLLIRKASHSLIAGLLIASMLSSCILISETPTSTEGVNYELTPTVENPATQELTLVSPTEVATEMPTITLTPEPTATATETPEPTPTVEPTSVTFSEKYPVKWSEGYTANVGGMEIPIDIGLTHWVMNRPDEPITEIYIAEDMVDKVGDYFMHMCFWRYTQLMDHSDVTYEQYLDLVAKGEGKLEIATYDESKPDQEVPEVTLIDPRNGFSFAWTDRDLPMELYTSSYYIGSSFEKFMVMEYLPSSEVSLYKSFDYPKGVALSMMVKDALFDIIDNISINNLCLINETLKNGCALSRYQEIFNTWRGDIGEKELDFYNGKRDTPLFEIVQP